MVARATALLVSSWPDAGGVHHIVETTPIRSKRAREAAADAVALLTHRYALPFAIILAAPLALGVTLLLRLGEAR